MWLDRGSNHRHYSPPGWGLNHCTPDKPSVLPFPATHTLAFTQSGRHARRFSRLRQRQNAVLRCWGVCRDLRIHSLKGGNQMIWMDFLPHYFPLSFSPTKEQYPHIHPTSPRHPSPYSSPHLPNKDVGSEDWNVKPKGLKCDKVIFRKRGPSRLEMNENKFWSGCWDIKIKGKHIKSRNTDWVVVWKVLAESTVLLFRA